MGFECYLVAKIEERLTAVKVQVNIRTIPDGVLGTSYSITAFNLGGIKVLSANIDLSDWVRTSVFVKNDEQTAWRLVSRAFLFEVLPNNRTEYAISISNAEQFEDAVVAVEERNHITAKVIYAFFEQLPNATIDENLVSCSTRLSPSHVFAAFEHFNNLYGVFRGVELANAARALNPGTLQQLRQFIREEQQTTMPTVMAPTRINRYFQIVPLGGELDNKPFIFIIMPFRPEELDQSIWIKVMRPALKEKFPDHEIIRSDSVTEPGKIDSQIFTAIVNAKIVVAEVTKPNTNVYYELGLAHALDKRVYMFCERNAIKQQALAFDIRQGRAEPYDDYDHLRQLIEEHVSLT